MRLPLAVAAGSALGAVARYLCSIAAIAALGPLFPWGTLLVNVAGSLLIGLYAALAQPGGRLAAGSTTHHFVVAGFLGGYTTFSIFSLEVLLLAESGAAYLAALYVLLSVALWLGAVWLGHAVARRAMRTN